MNKHLFMKVFLLVAVAFTVVLFLGGNAMAASKNCSLVGSWFGAAGDNTWFLIVTRGSSATVGQVYVHWTQYDPSPAVRLSDWMGVWEKVNNRLYNWTAVFYSYNADGTVFTTNRLTGTSSLVDCDHADDTWLWEVWSGYQDMTAPPDFSFEGTGTETRMSLAQGVAE